MTRIFHLVDASAGWQQMTALAQLVERLPADRYAQSVVSLSATPASLPLRAAPLPWINFLPWLAAPIMRKSVRNFRTDIIHAWSVDAAIAAGACEVPMVVHLFDPQLSPRDMKALRTLDRPTGLGIACASGTVRRRLIENGIPPQRCALIRPGVDFAWLGRQKRADIRRELKIPESLYAVIVTEPATRNGGHLEASFACQLASFVTPDFRIIVPGNSTEVARIKRFYAHQPRPEVLVCPGEKHAFLRLLSAADLLVVAPFGDAPTTAIAWAMAAGVPVLGIADYAIAELITHKVNGLLFKSIKGESRAVSLAKMLVQRQNHGTFREAARGQAYEVFSVRRCMDQHIRLYENLRAGKAADDGITDSAAVA